MAMKKRVYLTNAQKSEVIRLHGQGVGQRELADTYNVSQSVISKLVRGKAKTRAVITPAIRQEVVDLRNAGKTYAEIAELVGMARSTVWRVLSEHSDNISKLKKAKVKPVAPTKSGGKSIYLPASIYALANALRQTDEPDASVVTRALKNMAYNMTDDDFSRTAEGELEKYELEQERFLEERRRQVETTQAKDVMDGFKITLGIAAVIGLLLLALNQAGVLS